MHTGSPWISEPYRASYLGLMYDLLYYPRQLIIRNLVHGGSSRSDIDLLEGRNERQLYIIYLIYYTGIRVVIHNTAF